MRRRPLSDWTSTRGKKCESILFERRMIKVWKLWFIVKTKVQKSWQQHEMIHKTRITNRDM